MAFPTTTAAPSQSTTPAPAPTNASSPANSPNPQGNSAAPTPPAPDTATPPAPATPDPKAPEGDLSGRFAALTRKEKALLEREKQLKALEAKVKPVDELLGNAKANPLALLEKAGLTLEDLIQAQLGAGKPPSAEDQVKTVEQKIKDLEEKLQREREESERERNSRAVAGFKDQIRQHVDTNKESFELIALHNAYDEVFSVCETYFNENHEKEGFKPLEISKAAELVEQELLEQAKSWVNSNKYKKLFLPPETTPPSSDKQPAKDTQTPTTEPTLTNRGPTPSGKPSQTIQDREAAIRAIAAQYDNRV